MAFASVGGDASSDRLYFFSAERNDKTAPTPSILGSLAASRQTGDSEGSTATIRIRSLVRKLREPRSDAESLRFGQSHRFVVVCRQISLPFVIRRNLIYIVQLVSPESGRFFAMTRAASIMSRLVFPSYLRLAVYDLQGCPKDLQCSSFPERRRSNLRYGWDIPSLRRPEPGILRYCHRYIRPTETPRETPVVRLLRSWQAPSGPSCCQWVSLSSFQQDASAFRGTILRNGIERYCRCNQDVPLRFLHAAIKFLTR